MHTLHDMMHVAIFLPRFNIFNTFFLGETNDNFEVKDLI